MGSLILELETWPFIGCEDFNIDILNINVEIFSNLIVFTIILMPPFIIRKDYLKQLQHFLSR